MTLKDIGYRVGNALLGVVEYSAYLETLNLFGEKYADNIYFLGSIVILGTLATGDAITRISEGLNVIESFREYNKKQLEKNP